MKSAKRLISYVGREHLLRFNIVAICIILNSLVAVVASIFLKTLIDDYITPLIGRVNPDFGPTLRIIIIMFVFYVLSALCALIYNRLMVRIAQDVIRKVRNDMFSHLQLLPVKYFDTNEYGDVMSRFTNDTATLEEFLSRTLPDAISLIITIVGVLAAMIYLSPVMTLAVFLTLILVLLVSKLLTKKSKEYFFKQQMATGGLSGYTEESVEGLRTIKVFSCEEESTDVFEELNAVLTNATIKAVKYANTIMPVMSNLGNVQYAIIAIVGGLIAVAGPSAGLPSSVTGSITVGVIAAFLQMNKSFSAAISQLSAMMNSISQALAGSERIFKLLDEPKEEDKGVVRLITENGERFWLLGDATRVKADGHVILSNVLFEYEEGKQVLHNINMEIKPREKVAIVGSTGAGKTTIAGLINRFYDVNSGEITIDGINIKEIKKADLRRAVGVVLQDVNLFSDTILENIRYGSKDAALKDCIDAAKIANADEFIERLPNGYYSKLGGENHGISKGQMQLISIARAEASCPVLMVLDEATSSVDTRTELLINRGLDKLMENNTVLVIAHRLSTIINADKILVIEDGSIIESGTHDELLEAGGRYSDLYSGLTIMI